MADLRTLRGRYSLKKTTYMAQILQSISYKVCFIILPKFNKFGLLILILGTSVIMGQTACCYNMTTSNIGLYRPETFRDLLKQGYLHCIKLFKKERQFEFLMTSLQTKNTLKDIHRPIFLAKFRETSTLSGGSRFNFWAYWLPTP